jgi:hypothetical protein
MPIESHGGEPVLTQGAQCQRPVSANPYLIVGVGSIECLEDSIGLIVPNHDIVNDLSSRVHFARRQELCIEFAAPHSVPWSEAFVNRPHEEADVSEIRTRAAQTRG